jgi:molybdopterin synthase catalytic subunit
MVRIQREPFDVGLEIAALTEGRTDIGAVASFVGLVRDMADTRQVRAMTLEHYPGMTERQLGRIESEARSRWPLLDALIVHRYGRLEAGEPIVLVAAASAHREAALQACAFLMDWLKTRAPFWKLEETADGDQWVAARESDALAVARWAEPPTKP